MNLNLILWGILLLIGMFLISKLAKSACGSFLGKIGGALSPKIAEACEQAQTNGRILSFEPYVYIIGIGLLALGLIFPSGKKKVIVKEIIKTVYKEPKKEELKKEPTKRKVKFCRKCGAKVRGKFCKKCGAKL
jgi:hypothetical protein